MKQHNKECKPQYNVFTIPMTGWLIRVIANDTSPALTDCRNELHWSRKTPKYKIPGIISNKCISLLQHLKVKLLYIPAPSLCEKESEFQSGVRWRKAMKKVNE